MWNMQIQRRKAMVEQKYVNHRQLSRQLGLTWKQLSASEKQPFINEAQHLRLLHAVEFKKFTAGGTGNDYRVLYYGDERSLI